jgi:hypothetical protein
MIIDAYLPTRVSSEALPVLAANFSNRAKLAAVELHLQYDIVSWAPLYLDSVHRLVNRAVY